MMTPSELHDVSHFSPTERSRLDEADLSDANLGDAEMTYCSFYRTKLRGADLRGADLRKATFLIQGQIEEAVGNRHTRLSSPLRTPKVWSMSYEEQLERLKELDSEPT